MTDKEQLREDIRYAKGSSTINGNKKYSRVLEAAEKLLQLHDELPSLYKSNKGLPIDVGYKISKEHRLNNEALDKVKEVIE